MAKIADRTQQEYVYCKEPFQVLCCSPLLDYQVYAWFRRFFDKNSERTLSEFEQSFRAEVG